MALWFIMGFQIVALAASEIFQLLECRPVRAMWEPVVDAKCMPTQKVWVIGYVFVGRLPCSSCSEYLPIDLFKEPACLVTWC